MANVKSKNIFPAFLFSIHEINRRSTTDHLTNCLGHELQKRGRPQCPPLLQHSYGEICQQQPIIWLAIYDVLRVGIPLLFQGHQFIVITYLGVDCTHLLTYLLTYYQAYLKVRGVNLYNETYTMKPQDASVNQAIEYCIIV